MDIYEVDVGGYKTTLRLNVADAKRMGLYREPAQPEQAPAAPEQPDTPGPGKPDETPPDTPAPDDAGKPAGKGRSAANKARSADDVGNK